VLTLIVITMKRKCPTCKAWFEAVVPWKVYCKPYCRLKAHRQRKGGHDGKETS